MIEVKNEPLFETAHQALSFAYNFSASTLDRPMMSRMADKYKPTGKGLAKQDGAAQAGMILRRLRQLSRLHQMILIARFAPQAGSCVCCGGTVPNTTWMGAIREIAFTARAREVVPHHVKRMLCDGLVARYFGQKVHLQTLAKETSVAPNTVTKYNGLIVVWLRGKRFNRNEEVGAAVGEEQLAMDAAEAVLLDAGIIGESP